MSAHVPPDEHVTAEGYRYGIIQTMGLIRAAILSFVFAITSLVFVPPVYAIDGFITVTSPRGGETYTEGDRISVTWDSSANIDKVSIMYKSDAHHGNWVAFDTPNTHSYNWTVDVGNTTNENFYIEITGYETGKGSLTNFGGYFTVHQKADAPPSPTPTGSQSGGQLTVPTQQPGSNYPIPTGYYRYLQDRGVRITPTPKPTPVPVTVYSVTWSELFWFEGTMTTDLKTVKDPSRVERLTLDTKYGWTYTFTETLNLTDPKKIRMLKNSATYWTVEWWYVWIREEWWETFDVPADVTYKHPTLTAYAPTLILTDPEQNGAAASASAVAVTGSRKGEVTARINGPGKIEIAPRVVLTGPETASTDKPTAELTGKSSHADLSYRIKVNGKERRATPKAFDTATGAFTFDVSGLEEGRNVIELLYRRPDAPESESYRVAGSRILEYRPVTLAYLGMAVLAVFAVAYFNRGSFMPVLGRWFGKAGRGMRKVPFLRNRKNR